MPHITALVRRNKKFEEAEQETIMYYLPSKMQYSTGSLKLNYAFIVLIFKAFDYIPILWELDLSLAHTDSILNHQQITSLNLLYRKICLN